MTRSDMDIISLATDKERDTIIGLVDKLPSYFFGGYETWGDVVKELYGLVIELEQRQLIKG